MIFIRARHGIWKCGWRVRMGLNDYKRGVADEGVPRWWNEMQLCTLIRLNMVNGVIVSMRTDWIVLASVAQVSFTSQKKHRRDTRYVARIDQAS